MIVASRVKKLTTLCRKARRQLRDAPTGTDAYRVHSRRVDNLNKALYRAQVDEAKEAALQVLQNPDMGLTVRELREYLPHSLATLTEAMKELAQAGRVQVGLTWDEHGRELPVYSPIPSTRRNPA